MKMKIKRKTYFWKNKYPLMGQEDHKGDKLLYLMPGMGARSSIFKGLRFPSGIRPVYMEWLMPEGDEDLDHYTERLIRHYAIRPGSILLGMSFGGIMVHEIAKRLEVEKLIFVSTVKTHEAFPHHFHWGRKLRIWNLLPYGLITHPMRTAAWVPVGRIKKRLALYDQYMSIRDSAYFRWAMKRILTWQSPLPPVPYLHIHGDRDRIFPLRHLKGEVYPIAGGTHLAVMTHPKKINRILAPYLSEEA